MPFATAEQTGQVVEAAAAALPAWSETPVVERARLMFRFRTLLEQHFEELAALVTREHGKTLAEARAEVNRGIEVVEFACGIPSLITGEMLPNIAGDVDAEAVRHPVGVCVGITPYNFPFMVPLWMFPIAITCGNTFVLKPSEKVPLSAVRTGRAASGSGPARLASSTSSTATANASTRCWIIRRWPPYRSSARPRSPSTSTSAAPQPASASNRPAGRRTISSSCPTRIWTKPSKHWPPSAYGCAGQRCMAGSVAVAVGKAADPVVEGLVEYAGTLRVGPTDGNEDVDMGPVIRAEHRDRVASYLDIAKTEGAKVALDGRRDFESDGFLLGPSVVDSVEPDMRVWNEEIFGPVLSVVRAGRSRRGPRRRQPVRVRQRRRRSSPAAATPPANSSATSTPA